MLKKLYSGYLVNLISVMMTHSKCSALRRKKNAYKIQNDRFVKVLKHACLLNLHNVRVKVPPE